LKRRKGRMVHASLRVPGKVYMDKNMKRETQKRQKKGEKRKKGALRQHGTQKKRKRKI